MKKSETKLRRLVFVLSVVAVLSTTIGGYLYYSILRESSIERVHRETSEHLKILSDQIDSYLTWSLTSVKVLAGLKELEQLPVSGNAVALAEANAILDHFRDTMQASVTYLMDRSGNTIASSNRDTPVSFVGKNYGFLPYFQQAMQGFPAIYMALGVTSKKRGIYFSHPVYGKGKEGPLGVVVIKKSIELIEENLKFHKPHGGILLVTDPHGVVFVSDREGWLYHVLWEVSSEEIAEIAKARQFGEGPWDWTGMKLVDKNHAVDNLGNKYHVHQAEITKYSGWHVVFLHDHNVVSKRVTGSLLRTVGYSVLGLCVLIGISVFLLYRKANSEIIQRKRAEEALEKAHSELERRVQERTAELAEANEKLRRQITERISAEKALRESEKKLHFLSSHLLTAQERERRRISLELHDELGQSLTVLKLQVRSIERNLQEDQRSLKGDCESTLQYVDQIIENVRRLSRDLSPSILEDLGLTAAIRWLIENFAKHSNINVPLDMPDIDNLFSRDAQIILYRIFQEAFANIGKHAQATNVSVVIKKDEHQVNFLVEDNGKGFDLKQVEARNPAERSLGLVAMDERARMLGGLLEISGEEGKGTSITFSIPIDKGGGGYEPLSYRAG